MKGITVQELQENKTYGFELEVIAGSRGLSKKIYNPRIQKLGLIIAGFMVYLHPHRLQILGNTEISYLRQISPEEREKIIKELCGLEIVCFVVTRNLKVPEELLLETEARGIPVLRTKLVTSIFIERITKCLEEQLAPSTVVHGVLMEIMQPDAAVERKIERRAIRSGAPRPRAFRSGLVDFVPQELDNVFMRQKLALPPRQLACIRHRHVSGVDAF